MKFKKFSIIIFLSCFLVSCDAVNFYKSDTVKGGSLTSFENVDPYFYNAIVYDNFLRGKTKNMAYSDTGQEWETLSGEWGIIDNQAYETTGNGTNAAVLESGRSDGEVEVVFRNCSGSPRLLFRAKDNDNYWYVVWRESDKKLWLYKKVNGEDIYMGGGLTSQEGNEVRVALKGSSIKLYSDNTFCFECTDTFNQSETKHGIGNTSSTATRFSRFKVKVPEETNSEEQTSYSNNLIASVDNMLVKYENKTLSLSTDSGATYEKSFEIKGINSIKYVYLFGNGNLLFADDTKVYYSSDWTSYHESTILNQDGTKWVPESQYDNFSYNRKSPQNKIVNGREIDVWGNYSTLDGVQDTDNIRVWYTNDYGSTVKCCYIFNTPSTLKARHIHSIDYNPENDTYWLQTGDDENDSHWLKGTYDYYNDKWSWINVATGIHFKTSNIVFRGSYAYWSWDTTPGGVVRAPIATMSDISTHQVLLTTEKDCILTIVGPNGDIAAIQTVWGGDEKPRTLYYAPDGANFVRIVGDMPQEYYNTDDSQYVLLWPVNSRGKILSGITADSKQYINDRGRTPGIFLDDVIRENGYPNAFKKVSVVNGWSLVDGKWQYYKNSYLTIDSWVHDSHGWCYVDTEGNWMNHAGEAKDSTGVCIIGEDGYWTGERK